MLYLQLINYYDLTNNDCNCKQAQLRAEADRLGCLSSTDV